MGGGSGGVYVLWHVSIQFSEELDGAFLSLAIQIDSATSSHYTANAVLATRRPRMLDEPVSPEEIQTAPSGRL